MKAYEYLNKNIVLVALVIAILGRLVVSYPPDTNLLQGTDSIAYMHRIWLAGAGNIYWDNFWYGGYPSLNYYAPLNYLFGGFFSLFAGPIIAYKIIIDFFFALAPIAFYLFVRDFEWSPRQKALSVLLFSFFPINIYYFWNGSYVTIINILFSLLVWRHFKLYAEKGRKKDLAFSALFLGISILVHNLTALINLALVFFWIAARYKKLLLRPALSGLLVSLFWLFPFMTELSGESFLKPVTNAWGFVSNAVFHLGSEKFLLILIIFAAMTAAALRFKDRETVPFMTVLLLIGSFIFFTTYNRVLIFLSLPVAVILADMAPRSKTMVALAVMSAFVFAAVFYSFQPFFFLNTHEAWELPAAENRVMYYPPAYALCFPDKCASNIMEFTLVAPMRGQETVSGWFHQSQKPLAGRDEYLQKISNPLIVSQEELYSFLKAGYAKTVIVSKFYPEYEEYFIKSANFGKINETERFIVFSLYPEPSYVEIDGKNTNYSLSRNGNRIKINFACSPGTLAIKESYDSWWAAELNGKPLKLRQNKYGFMESDINESGSCEIKLSFLPKPYHAIFYLISFLALIFLLILFYKGNRQ